MMLPGRHSGSVNDVILMSQLSSTQSRLLSERKEALPDFTQLRMWFTYSSAVNGNVSE